MKETPQKKRRMSRWARLESCFSLGRALGSLAPLLCQAWQFAGRDNQFFREAEKQKTIAALQLERMMCMVWQLLQVRHLHGTPLILVGNFWDGLLDWTKEQMLRPDIPLVSPHDLTIPQVMTDAPSIVQAIRDHYERWKQGAR